jgi:hypothetical protein
LGKEKTSSSKLSDWMIKNSSHEKATQKSPENPQKTTKISDCLQISREKTGIRRASIITRARFVQDSPQRKARSEVQGDNFLRFRNV